MTAATPRTGNGDPAAGGGATRGLPRLCLAGPMVGRTPGYVTTQGEILSDHLASEGYAVISTSTVLNRYFRLADIVQTLIRNRGRFDILLVQTFSGASFVVADVASWIGRRLGCRVLFHLHGGALPAYMARFPRWYRRVFDRADAMVAPSHYLAREIGKHGYRVRVIANSLDLADYTFRVRRSVSPRLFWMRSFHPLYNPGLAIRVLARLRRDGIDATLVMAGGDKGERPATEELARTLGVSASVRFAGFLSMAGKAKEGDAADIFINTNDVDNMPVAVVEACAMGLPVVSTAVGGIPDLLADGETGLLVPAGDEERMAGAVRRLLGEPALAERLSSAGRWLAERSSWQEVRKEWDTLLAELR